MDVVIVPDEAAGARVVADMIQETLTAPREGRPVLGLATGSSPVAAYRELVRRHREEGLSFAGARVFMLDEYIGLPPGHEQSYHRFIRENLTSHVDIDDAMVQSPRGVSKDPAAEARRYDLSIAAAGGVDLQLLGIGANGHIAFNEPGSSLASRTHPVWLTERTIHDNARFFESEDDVPVQALTQGLETIREARRIVLTATGEHKAEAIAAMAEGPVSARCPASCLQLHPDVTVVVDEAAASRLELADYYRYQRRMSEKARSEK